MYDACGGAASLVLARIVWIQPRLPLVTASRAARKPASKRRWKPMWTGTIPSATRAAISRVPDRSEATGFSQNVVSPASWARPISSAWALVGAQMAMPSRPDRKQRLDVGDGFETELPGHRLCSRASVSVTTTCSTLSSAFRVVAWNSPIRPTPTNPMRMLRPFRPMAPAVCDGDTGGWSRLAGRARDHHYRGRAPWTSRFGPRGVGRGQPPSPRAWPGRRQTSRHPWPRQKRCPAPWDTRAQPWIRLHRVPCPPATCHVPPWRHRLHEHPGRHPRRAVGLGSKRLWQPPQRLWPLRQRRPRRRYLASLSRPR